VACVDSSLQTVFRYKGPLLRCGMVLSALPTCCFVFAQLFMLHHGTDKAQKRRLR
jgi:hypothetical protein